MIILELQDFRWIVLKTRPQKLRNGKSFQCTVPTVLVTGQFATLDQEEITVQYI